MSISICLSIITLNASGLNVPLNVPHLKDIEWQSGLKKTKTKTRTHNNAACKRPTLGERIHIE